MKILTCNVGDMISIGEINLYVHRVAASSTRLLVEAPCELEIKRLYHSDSNHGLRSVAVLSQSEDACGATNHLGAA